jgi:hypothetical protein
VEESRERRSRNRLGASPVNWLHSSEGFPVATACPALAQPAMRRTSLVNALGGASETKIYIYLHIYGRVFAVSPLFRSPFASCLFAGRTRRGSYFGPPNYLDFLENFKPS